MTSRGATPELVEPVELERLARKYRRLAELRRARARGEPIPERAVFRELAGEFPGALHELDNLPLEEIDRRAEALATAIAGGPAEPWMAWMARYHALMRAALYVKIRVARRPPLSGEQAAALAAKAGAHAGADVGAAFVLTVADPPEGRLNRVVDAALAAAFAAPAEEIRRALFPRRRAG
jgi:hypothetical protein